MSGGEIILGAISAVQTCALIGLFCWVRHLAVGHVETVTFRFEPEPSEPGPCPGPGYELVTWLPDGAKRWVKSRPQAEGTSHG